MSLTKFEIILHNPKSVFAAGDLISGEVILDLSKTKTCRGVKLKFVGSANVHWSESYKKNNKTYTEHFVSDEKYFDTDIYVIGNGGGEVELIPGHHVFPFTFPLPLNIPDTFRHNLGYVRYSIKAMIDRPWKFDHVTKRDFRVETPYDISEYNQRRIDDEVNENFCCCILPCIRRGNIGATIRLPSNAYVTGDALKAFITIDSQSGSVSVADIKLKLIQRMQFHARSPRHKSKTDEKIIQRVTLGGMVATGHEYTVGMKVPSLPPSGFRHCGIININYQLKVTLVIFGCHCNIKKTYDVVIGSLDSRAAHCQAGGMTGVSHYFTPNAPPEFGGPSAAAPIGFHLPGSSLPTPDSGMHMPTAPDGLPPSYDAVMAESAKK